MSDIFQEVDDALHDDRKKAFWNAYGKWIIMGAVAIILGTAAGVGWKEYNQSKLDADGAAYSKALQQINAGQLDEAKATLDGLSQGAHAGYGAVAIMLKGSALADSGDREGALAAFAQVASAGDAPKRLQGLANLRTAYLLMEEKALDEAKAKLTLLSQDGNAWRYSAREALGLVAIEQGDMTAAEKIFKELSEENNVPPAIAQRANAIAATLTAK